MDIPKQGWTPYDNYTTEILLQAVKSSKLEIVYASNPGHLLHTSYPYPLDHRGLADENGNFLLISALAVTTNDN